MLYYKLKKDDIDQYVQARRDYFKMESVQYEDHERTSPSVLVTNGWIIRRVQCRGQACRLHAECYERQCRGQCFLLNVSMRNLSHGSGPHFKCQRLTTLLGSTPLRWRAKTLELHNGKRYLCDEDRGHRPSAIQCITPDIH